METRGVKQGGGIGFLLDVGTPRDGALSVLSLLCGGWGQGESHLVSTEDRRYDELSLL